MELAAAHALVTGASRGIGEALTRELVGRGVRVTALARSKDALERLSQATGATPFVADLAASSHLDEIVPAVEERGGPVDLLVNNAALVSVGEFRRMTPDDVREHVSANLLAPMLLTRAALPGMIERERGTVVFVSSVAGEMATRNVAAYASTKAGLSNFAQTLRRELRRTPVNVVPVVLGEVDTSMLDDARTDPIMSQIVKRVGKLRSLTPEEVAVGIADAAQRDRPQLVLPRAARPLLALRNVPSRLMDLAMVGVKDA